ncbi:MAG: OPT/YSL family transporter [Polyangiaceae bacterium]|nr:OPT/YSL family transporter [Polyangiaceae bacterium]MCE7891647.1 OPT family oligopeptide transporter [Sorangiineae bacterium PRO1]MCL4753687.1 OPT/YSL family transporter [Myxococcales bacterium]
MSETPSATTPPTVEAAAEVESPSEYPPLDRESPQLTLRAVLTGCLLGGVLSLSNIYAGLKIGWGFNMSITAMLLAFALFKVASRSRPFGMLENNINQTAASAAASISSAGLVAPIPAYTILTGEKLGWAALVIWTAAVSLVGVVVAVGLRRQMIMVDKLPFPGGVASAETIKQIYAHGKEAMARVKLLLAGAAVGGGTKLLAHFAKLHAWGPPASIAAKAGGASGAQSYTFANLGLALDPSVLMIGVGAIIGLRAGVSLLLGTVVAWGILSPIALDAGWASPGKLDATTPWFGAINKWLLWPGVGMMVAASLTSFAFSWRSIVSALRGGAGNVAPDPEDVPRKVFITGIVVVLVLATVPQVAFFGVPLWLAAGAVVFTFLLAVVAGRVSGETGITPVGPMGKVTQLLFGVLSPGDVAGNLMAANVTGGAASQVGDLLHDLKTGALIGASPRQQAIGQTCGVLMGAVVGSAGYLVLVPDPKKMLLTPEWPAPAVAAWKAVAELFKVGFSAMPPKALEAMAIAVALGVVLAALEKLAPEKIRSYVPSANSLGLAAVVPAYNSISMFVGAVLAAVVTKLQPGWSKRFMIVLAAGLIAGESLVGVGLALWQTVTGLAGK